MGLRLQMTLCSTRMRRRAAVSVMIICIIYLISSNHDQIKAMAKCESTAFPGTRFLRNIVEYPEEKYYIVPNIDLEVQEMRDGVVNDTEITLCTQASLNNLFRITSLVEAWNGKISIVVFAFDETVSEAHGYIKLLQQCSQGVVKHVRFHIVFPVDRPPKHLNTSEEATHCQQLSVLKEKFHGRNYDSNSTGIPYPVNVLRNVALMYASTPYVISMDIDFLPSKMAKPDMETFLGKLNDSAKEKKLLYVLPSFEANISRTDLLKSKEKLLKAVNVGHARQFTVKKCPICHNSTNFTRWLSLPFPSKMGVAYLARYRFLYEPFYVAQKERVPMFDGRFKQYGFNRNSQVCEAYFSGYDFAVMNNAYAVHDGFKDPVEFKRNKGKQRDLKLNGKHVSDFLNDLKSKYPKSTRKCR